MTPKQYAEYIADLKRRAAADPAEHERQWQLTLKTAELFKRDHPTGRMPTPLPGYRSSYPDPLRMHYEKLAEQELKPDRGPRR